MKFAIPIGKFKIIVHLADVNPADRDLEIGLGIGWGSHSLNLTLRIAWS